METVQILQCKKNVLSKAYSRLEARKSGGKSRALIFTNFSFTNFWILYKPSLPGSSSKVTNVRPNKSKLKAYKTIYIYVKEKRVSKCWAGQGESFGDGGSEVFLHSNLRAHACVFVCVLGEREREINDR